MEDIAELFSGIEPQPMLPSGEVDLSESTRRVKVMISGRWSVVCVGSGAGEEYTGEMAEEKTAIFLGFTNIELIISVFM